MTKASGCSCLDVEKATLGYLVYKFCMFRVVAQVLNLPLEEPIPWMMCPFSEISKMMCLAKRSWHPQKKSKKHLCISHRIHGTGIFTDHLVDFYGKCRYIYIPYIDPIKVYVLFPAIPKHELIHMFVGFEQLQGLIKCSAFAAVSHRSGTLRCKNHDGSVRSKELSQIENSGTESSGSHLVGSETEAQPPHRKYFQLVIRMMRLIFRMNRSC